MGSSRRHTAARPLKRRDGRRPPALLRVEQMIRKLQPGRYRLYSKKKNPKTGRRRNLGTFRTRAQAEKHERAVQLFKRRGR